MKTDELRAILIGKAGCREYAARYLHAAQKARRRYGRRSRMRRIWIPAAWFFRGASRG